MARKKHLINVHTSTGTTAPTGASLYLGEIAVQHTTNDPALWIKMGSSESSTEYEKFIGKTEIINMLEDMNILGSGYTYSGLPYVNSATSIADAYSALTMEMIIDEMVASAALNDLNDRVLEVSAATQNLHVDMILGETYTYSGLPYVNSATSIADAYSALTNEVLNGEKITAAALNDLNGRVLEVSAATQNLHVDMILGETYTYSGLPYVNSSTTIADAYSALTNELFKDEKVTAAGLNNLNDRVTVLEEGGGASSTELQELSAAVKTKEFVIAAALNDLNERVIELSGNTGSGGGGEGRGGDVGPLSAIVVELSATLEDDEFIISQAINDLNDRVTELSGNTGGGGGGGADIQPLSSATYSHVNNATVHITSTERARWNNAWTSGVSAYTRVNALSAATYTHSGDTTRHITSTERTNWNNAWTSGVSAYTRVNALSAAVVSLSAAVVTVSANTGGGGGGDTSSCVHKTGDETIAGDKTFTDDIVVGNASNIKYGASSSGGFTKATKVATGAGTNSISFTGLTGEPKAFVANVETPGSNILMVIGDSSGVYGIYNNGSQHNYSASFTKSYSNGTLTITAPAGITFASGDYDLSYYYGSGTLTFKTTSVTPGQGQTSATFTGSSLTEVPAMYVCFLESAVNNESYRRVAGYTNSAAFAGATASFGVTFLTGGPTDTTSSFSVSYSNGLVINSGGMNAGGYFHNPGTYTLYYLMASDIGGGGGSYSDLAAELSAITTDISALETGKQATLVSGTNIKTVNNNSLLGNGNVTIATTPTVTATNNGQILEVSNGAWAAGRKITVSSSEPTSTTGNNGDIWIVV